MSLPAAWRGWVIETCIRSRRPFPSPHSTRARKPAKWPIAFTQDGEKGELWPSASPKPQSPPSLPWDRDVLVQRLNAATREIVAQFLSYGAGGRGNGDSTLHIESEGFRDAVVWNPGATLAASMGDLGAGEHLRFVCVEAATVVEPVTLAPGERWLGVQRLRE